MDGQKNRFKEEERIDKWLIFFLESLIELTKRLSSKYEIYSKLKIALNERQQEIVAYVKAHETAQIKEIEQALGGYSRNTIKKDMTYLVNEGVLLRTGAGRGVRYYVKK